MLDTHLAKCLLFLFIIHEALLVVDKMAFKDRSYIEILNVIWGLSNTAACVVQYVVVSNMISSFVSEQSISHAYEEIASCKTELQQAKRIRRNRQGIIDGSKVIIEQLICGILWIVLLNCVIQSLFLKIAWGPNYLLKNRNFYNFFLNLILNILIIVIF